jgi:hypothetical protein
MAIPAARSEKPLTTRFSQMLAAFELSQQARADRIIRRFSYLGARVSDGKGKAAHPAPAPRCTSTVGI